MFQFVDLKNMMRDYNELIMNSLLISSHCFLLFSVCQLGQNILDHGIDLHKRTLVSNLLTSISIHEENNGYSFD